jgi:hypothetical protein
VGDDRDDLYNSVMKRMLGRPSPQPSPLAPLSDNIGDLNLGDVRPRPGPPLAPLDGSPPGFRDLAAAAPASVRQDAEAFASRRMDLIEKPGGAYQQANLNQPTTMAYYKTARDHLRDLYLLGKLRPDQQIGGQAGGSIPASQMLQELKDVNVHVGQAPGRLKLTEGQLSDRGYQPTPNESNDPNSPAYIGAGTYPPTGATTDVYINPWHPDAATRLNRFATPEIGLNWVTLHEIGGHSMRNSRRAGELESTAREAYANSGGGGFAAALGALYPTGEELKGPLGGTINRPPLPPR